MSNLKNLSSVSGMEGSYHHKSGILFMTIVNVHILPVALGSSMASKAFPCFFFSKGENSTKERNKIVKQNVTFTRNVD